MPAKPTATFDMFLQDVSPENLPFVMETDTFLQGMGYTVKVELAKSGYVVSYNHPKSKKVLLNYVFRKSGMLVRLYLDGIARYPEVLLNLPEKMNAAIAKAPACRRMLNPADCNPRCAMGYAFTLQGEAHQKCRYNSFLLPVNTENAPALEAMLRKEAAARDAA